MKRGVLVSMHNLKGWEFYQHCLLRGKIQKKCKDDKNITVQIPELEETVRVHHKRVSPMWVEPYPNVIPDGQKVYVYFLRNGVSTWWEATILYFNYKVQTYLVKWTGDYQEHGDIYAADKSVVFYKKPVERVCRLIKKRKCK